MAWPNTPLTTYVAGNPPAIKAADLNSMQDATNQTINGTYTVNALTADGTGGAVVAPVAGTTKVSANLTESALPGTARAPGLDCIGTRLWGWCCMTGAGTFKRGWNVFAATRSGVGQYVITFYGAPSDASFTLPFGSASSPGTALSLTFSTGLSGGNLQVSVDVRDGANALTDALLSIGICAE